VYVGLPRRVGSVPGVSELESDREVHEILARTTGTVDPDELVDALFDDLKRHDDAGAAEPGRRPGDRAEVAIVLDRDLIGIGQRRGEKRRVAEHRPQYRASDRHRGLAADDHRDTTCTPRGPAWAVLRSRSYTRSALLWVSNTMCGLGILDTGLALLPMTVVTGAMAFLSGRLVSHIGEWTAIVVGLSAGAGGALLIALAPRAGERR